MHQTVLTTLSMFIIRVLEDMRTLRRYIKCTMVTQWSASSHRMRNLGSIPGLRLIPARRRNEQKIKCDIYCTEKIMNRKEGI